MLRSSTHTFTSPHLPPLSRSNVKNGFNGMERIDEMEGEGNAYDFGARIYDPRIGRWFSRDLLEDHKPSYSPYQAFLLNPLLFKDVDGNDEFLTIVYINKQTNQKGYLRMAEPLSQNVIAGARVHRRALQDNQSYYDFRHVITVMIDENGKQHINDNIIFEKQRYTDFCVVCKSENDVFNPHDANKTFSLFGDGEKQNHGDNYTTNKGGDSPTKTKSKTSVGSNDLEDFMTSLGGFCKSLLRDGKLEDNENTKKISEFVRDGVDKIEEAREDKENDLNEYIDKRYGKIHSNKLIKDKEGTGTLRPWATRNEIRNGDTVGGAKDKLVPNGTNIK